VFAEHIARWAKLWGVRGRLDVSVAFGARLRSSLGRCHPESGRILLNPALREAPHEVLLETLCHEVAHVVVHRRFGRRARPHGAEWRALLRAAGFAPRACADVRPSDGALYARVHSLRPWLHRCPRCGAERRARRAMLRWRCGRCRRGGHAGRLVIERRPCG
jgi:predicted SprT family Zn-dependent metalloprotease